MPNTTSRTRAPAPARELLTARQAMAALQVKKTTFYRYQRRGLVRPTLLPSGVEGGRPMVRYDWSQLEALLRRLNRTRAAQAAALARSA